MKRFLLTLAVLLLLSWVIPGSTEKCWNLRGSCREKCIKNEKIYVFCMSGKLCCVKPKFQPKSLQTWSLAGNPGSLLQPGLNTESSQRHQKKKKTSPKICTEPQKILNIQSNPEKEQSWKHHTS
ncbi:beta-defensin 118-like [Prionailurus viverrinus]|uniref:beta-defensin 118-like n=1 Tax=Prionailurus viverrinus TaxID=61388 RepID=UPI001FF21D4A|nr:beta-defensin 118-like [Prionailurus viverrinus]